MAWAWAGQQGWTGCAGECKLDRQMVRHDGTATMSGWLPLGLLLVACSATPIPRERVESSRNSADSIASTPVHAPEDSEPNEPPSCENGLAPRWQCPGDCDWWHTQSPEVAGMSRAEMDEEGRRCRVRESFRAFVASRQGCTEDSECEVLFPGCLGCSVGVHRHFVAEVNARIVEALEEFCPGGCDCKFKGCFRDDRAVCMHGFCR
jgi:hypothetical protein